MAPPPVRPRRSLARTLALRARSPLFRSDLVQATAGGALGCFGWAVLLCTRLRGEEGVFLPRTAYEAHFAALLQYAGLSGKLSSAAATLAKTGFVFLLVGLVAVFSLSAWVHVARPALGQWLQKRGALLLASAATVPWFGGNPHAGLGFWATLGLTLVALGLLVVVTGALSQDATAPRWLRATSWMLVILMVAATGLHANPTLARLALWPPLELTALLVLVVWMLAVARLAKSRATLVILRRLSEQASSSDHK